MKGFFKEFKEFALRGNVMDLAVAVIIGAAFQSIVTSLTNDILSPIIGILFQDNFTALAFTVNGATISYGAFITAIINFTITAFVIFLLVKGINKLSTFGKKEQEEAPKNKKCPYCYSDVAVEATRCPHCTSQL